MWILNRVEDDGGAVEDDEVGPLRMTIVESRMAIVESRMAVVEPRMMFGELRMMVGLLGCALLSPTYRPGSYVISGPELRHPRPRSGIQCER